MVNPGRWSHILKSGRSTSCLSDGFRLVDVSICRPAPGHFEVAKLTHQVGHQRAERAALGDRIPPAALADAPPEAAPANGDLSWPADSEPAPALHAPHGEARRTGRRALNRLIKPTHRKACSYPARTPSCVRCSYFWAHPQPGILGRSTDRASRQVPGRRPTPSR